jgi:anti-anti-sigma factor
MNIEIIDSNAERTYIIKEMSLSTNIIKFEEILDEFIQTDERDMIIDLSYVKRIDSMSLASFLRIKKKLIGQGRTLSLTNPTESVMRLLEFSGLDTYLLD